MGDHNNFEMQGKKHLKDMSETNNSVKQQQCPTRRILTVLVVIALLAGVVVACILLLPSHPDDTPPEKCNQLPPRFGNECQHRCHCLNLTEFCNKETGHCTSGCLHGWIGDNCQTSIYISVTVEPKYQVTVPGSTKILCHANVSNYEWKEIHLDYTNDTATQRILSILPTASSPIFGNKANATILSKNDMINISFGVRIPEDMAYCNTKIELTCNIEFLDKTLGRKNDTGTVLVKGPPTNLSLDLEAQYITGVDATLNCTATMDPNNTMLFLVGKETTAREPTMAPTINVQTFVEQSNDCCPKVRVVYPADFTFLRSNSFLACIASDNYYGKNFTSEYKTPSITIIN